MLDEYAWLAVPFQLIPKVFEGVEVRALYAGRLTDATKLEPLHCPKCLGTLKH